MQLLISILIMLSESHFYVVILRTTAQCDDSSQPIHLCISQYSIPKVLTLAQQRYCPVDLAHTVSTTIIHSIHVIA